MVDFDLDFGNRRFSRVCVANGGTLAFPPFRFRAILFIYLLAFVDLRFLFFFWTAPLFIHYLPCAGTVQVPQWIGH